MKEIPLTQGKVALVDDEAAIKYYRQDALLNFPLKEGVNV